jgi:hypothetical protein
MKTALQAPTGRLIALIGALAALSSAVTLAAAQTRPPAAAPANAASPPATAPGTDRDRNSAILGLDTNVVKQRVPPGARTRDAFAKKSWFVAPPPPPPAPPPPPPAAPPPPQAPPLPFKYLGRLQESADRTVWYLLQGERFIVAATGELIDAVYRIEGADAGQLRFRYLPLDQRQTLTIGAAP